MKKQSITVEGFTVEAEIDDIGLLHIVVNSGAESGALMVNHPSSHLGAGTEHQVFSNDPAIIDWELGHCDEIDGDRPSPEKLREAAKSKAFRAWWALTNKMTPEAYADKIDGIRRREKAAGLQAEKRQ